MFLLAAWSGAAGFDVFLYSVNRWLIAVVPWMGGVLLMYRTFDNSPRDFRMTLHPIKW